MWFWICYAIGAVATAVWLWRHQPSRPRTLEEGAGIVLMSASWPVFWLYMVFSGRLRG